MLYRCSAVFFLSLASIPSAQGATVLSESFDNVPGLFGSGWTSVNNSAPIGVNSWFQGLSSIFSAHAGPPNSYIATNFNAGSLGAVSLWLITPQLSLNNGDTINFVTRVDNVGFFDQLQVRLSLSGVSGDVGSTHSSVGDFTNLLGTVNPGPTGSGYPGAWTAFSFVVSGLSGPQTGRYAFRYVLADASVDGDYIGIDSLTITTADTLIPEPRPLMTVFAALVTLYLVRRRAT